MKLKRLINKIARYQFGYNKSRKQLLNMMPKHAVCAEIGVWKGAFSKMIVHHTEPNKLHLIDPWKYQSEFDNRLYSGLVAKNQKDMDDIYNEVVQLFSENSNVLFNRSYSAEAAETFAEGYFDWIYIDGNHNYEYVLEDLQKYFPKIKKGGFITGDDYLWSSEELNKDLPVRRAVQDFMKQNDKVVMHKLLGSQFILRKINE